MTRADSATALRMSLTSEPVGQGQAEATPEAKQALCILCSGPTSELVLIASYESASNSGALWGCGYCAEMLGKRGAV